MKDSVSSFLVYHAAVGQRTLPEHFNFDVSVGIENYVLVEGENGREKLVKKLVEIFSHPGDWILDVNLPEGS